MSLIKEFHKEKGEELGISLELCEEVCKSPFIFVKEVMNSGILKNIRFKYLGLFEVSASRVKYSKKTLEEKYAKGLVSEKRYQERIKVLSNYESKD